MVTVWVRYSIPVADVVSWERRVLCCHHHILWQVLCDVCVDGHLAIRPYWHSLFSHHDATT